MGVVGVGIGIGVGVGVWRAIGSGLLCVMSRPDRPHHLVASERWQGQESEKDRQSQSIQ